MNIQLQVLGHALRAIAEEMGAVLIRSAFSANIKERRDCSTALFDERGRMIAQAEHIPVHLGAMPDAVAAVAAHEPERGELWVLNDPFAGGTHLPDVTVVSRTVRRLRGPRAHHADVGAREPGSMPAESQRSRKRGSSSRRRGSTTRSSSRWSRACGTPTSDTATSALRSRPTGSRRGGSTSSANGADATGSSRRWTSCMRTRSASSARRSQPFPTAATRPRTCSRDRGRPHDQLRGHQCRRRARHRLRRHVGPARRQPQPPLAVARSASYFVVRCVTDPDLPASGGAFAPVR